MRYQIGIVQSVILVCSILILNAVIPPTSATSRTNWPTSGWEVSQTERQGMNFTDYRK